MTQSTSSSSSSSSPPMETTNQPVRILGWAEFIAHPYRLHSIFGMTKQGELLYDKSHVINLTHSQALENLDVIVQKEHIIVNVRTTEELSMIHDLFLCRLLLLRITIDHTEISSKYSAETVRIVEDDFAVLINSQHPALLPSINAGFHSSMEQLKAKKKFCLEFDVSDMVLDWYTEVRDAITSCDDIHNVLSKGSRVCLTNHSLYNHSLDCNTHWILFLCICWIMMAPCYKIHRKLTCTDITVKLKCDVTPASLCNYTEMSRVVIQNVNAKNYDAV